jgi:hypothetical protein
MVTNKRVKKQRSHYYLNDKEALEHQFPVYAWKNGECVQVAKVLPERAGEQKKREMAEWEAKKIKRAVREARSSIRKGKQAKISSFFIE